MKYKVGMHLKRVGKGGATSSEFNRYKGKVCTITEVTNTHIYFTKGNYTGGTSSIAYADIVFKITDKIYLGGE